MPEASSIMDPVLLQPFCHQVGGSTSVMSFNETTLCKPLNPREQYFYLNMPPDLKEFTPEYRGLIEVKLEEDSDGYITYKGYPSDLKNSSGSNSRLSQDSEPRSSPESSSSEDSPVVMRDRKKITDPDTSASIRLLRSGSVEVSTQTATMYHVIDPERSGNMKGVNPWSVKCQKRLISKMKKIDKDSRTCKFILLENVAAKFRNPCVLDIKMGTRQHGDDVTEEKKQRFIKKCENSTSSIIGTRLIGMQVYQANTGKYICHNKYFGRSLTLDGFKETLYQFFHNGCELRTDVIEAIVTKLQKLSRILTEHETFRFYSSSLLIMYEGQPQDDNAQGQSSSNGPSKGDKYDCENNQKDDKRKPEDCKIDIRMIDFAHSTHKGFYEDTNVHNGPDSGYLFGLRHLIDLFKEIRKEGSK